MRRSEDGGGEVGVEAMAKADGRTSPSGLAKRALGSSESKDWAGERLRGGRNHDDSSIYGEPQILSSSCA